MFVPPYHMITQHIKALPVVGGSADQVIMKLELFRLMLRCALECCEFDEAQYQLSNPDVAEAVGRRKFSSGREHFLAKGYFEGRVGAVPVHEAWYLSHSPDVAEAKRAGLMQSAEAHYRMTGACEWREPNPGCALAVRAWKKLLISIERVRA